MLLVLFVCVHPESARVRVKNMEEGADGDKAVGKGGGGLAEPWYDIIRVTIRKSVRLCYLMACPNHESQNYQLFPFPTNFDLSTS